MSDLPLVAITCGEPAGIGPELMPAAYEACRYDLALCWIGDKTHLPEDLKTVEIADPADARTAMSEGMPVLHRDFGAPRRPGQPDPLHAQPVIDAIAEAVALAQAGKVAALCTAPIAKKALKDGAGFAFPGHTEFLGHLGGTRARAVMMLASDALRVVPVTIHIPLSDVPSALTADLLEETVRTTHCALKQDFGLPNPRIAVAGVNPHAGEGGAMGREELTLITPVLDRLRAEGMTLAGPLPADTMFHAEARARYDAAIGMYHDQVLVPIKTLAFDTGVNVTLGLPFVRTSPDHGTAFDIAGKGLANPSSMIAALRMAASIARTRAGAP